MNISADFVTAEKVAASLVRGLDSPQGSWGDLIAVAQMIIGQFQEIDLSSASAARALYHEDMAVPLVAAARILDSASQATANLPSESTESLAILAGVTFAMAGNFASSRAAFCRRPNQELFSSPSRAVAVATCAPGLLGHALRWVSDSSPAERSYLEQVEFFLSSGVGDSATLESGLIECILGAQSSFDGVLLRSCRIVIRQLVELSTARVVRTFLPHLGLEHAQRLVAAGIKTLLPPQYMAIAEKNLLSNKENALIALPTSTGKTLIAEFCMVAALGDKPGVAVYLTPYVALGRQVSDSLRQHLPKACRIYTLVGGFKNSYPTSFDADQVVIVATPESFDGWLRSRPELMYHLKVVVLDEAHLIQNGSRGLLIEGIFARLLLQQRAGRSFRMILLSAVLPQYDDICRWLSIPPGNVIVTEWRPTARRLAFWSQNGELRWVLGDDVVRKKGQTEASVTGRKLLPWPEPNVYATDFFGAVKEQEGLVHKNIAYLAEFLLRQFGGAILCVCATKQATRQIARAVASRLPEISPLPGSLADLLELISTRFIHLNSLGRLLSRGVAYHNATLPYEVKAKIEDAVKSRDLCVVAATTTLAEGVDLPFRATILVDWLTWSRGNQTPLSPLTFRNIAGRCGRAGVFTEGDTVIFDNPLGDLRFTRRQYRERSQGSLVMPPPSLRSAIDEMWRAGARQEVEAILSSQLIGAIPENPTEWTLAEAFSRCLYSTHNEDGGARVLRLAQGIAEDLQDPALGAFAVAASPLHLTALGEAANAAGFSPASCRALLEYLPKIDPGWPLASVGAALLRNLGQLPEQSADRFRDLLVKKRTKSPVKPDDFELVLQGYLAGDRLMDIFERLPYVKRSRRYSRFLLWKEGLEPGDDWAYEFDRFVELVETAFESYLPWLMRACRVLYPFAVSAGMDWDAAIEKLEARKRQLEQIQEQTRC